MKDNKFSFDDNLLKHNEFEGLKKGKGKGKLNDDSNPQGLGAPLPKTTE
ncbi:hypothetical protein [Bacillus sp. V3-13]|nr:hypothetical protein [Bacillus sp. V3-13]